MICIARKALVLLTTLILGLQAHGDEHSAPHYHVAILQFVQHPALDLEREAIIAKLAESGFKKGDNLTIHYFDAQGNIAQVHQISSQIVAVKPHVVVAIATPAAQALSAPLKQNNIPMVFTAVTDPVGAKLVKSLENKDSETLVTGVTDAIDLSKAVGLIKKMMPTVKKIGLIYNPSEPNSVKQVQEIKTACQNASLEVVESAATGTAQVYTATTALIDTPDLAILLPNDNVAVAAGKTIVNAASKKNIPVFAADIGSLQNGAVAVAALDRKILGGLAGELAVKILKGQKPSELSVQNQTNVDYIVNPESAKNLSLSIPSDVKHMNNAEGVS